MMYCLQQVVGVWAQEVRDATTVAVNHKYTLMAFGCAGLEIKRGVEGNRFYRHGGSFPLP